MSIDDTNECEIWKDIPGYEGYYKASRSGHILSRFGTILVPSPVGSGLSKYRGVTLSIKGVLHSVMVHKLIALTFLGPVPDGLEINHINLNKTDNRLSNLEYVTHKHNIKHAIFNGVQLGTKSRLSDETIGTIFKMAHSGIKQKVIAEQFGISLSYVQYIKRGMSHKKQQG